VARTWRYVRAVTDPLDVPTIARRYRLATFGPPALFGADADTFLGQHGHHRRRLALLAVLAAAGERGRSRDQLLLLFWPDATQTRARHSLGQLLYALRTSLGDTVFDGVNPVRLNPDLICSDVAAFNAALERDDIEAAVNEYRGPFLDGFYVDDAPEFERWVETERERLAARYAGALERLARDASAAGDHVTAVDRWKTLVETDPMSSRNATGLIGALMNAGDHSSALQYAKQYEALVTKELGVGAGPAVATLVDEVRAKAGTEPLSSLPPAQSTTQQAQPEAPLTASSRQSVEHPPQLPSARRRSLPFLMLTVTALVLLAVTVSLRPKTRDTTALRSAEPSIAVLPFANVGGDPQDGAFVDGLSEELIGVLAKLEHLRVVGPTSVLAFKNTKIGVRRIADSLGVANILEGDVQTIGSHLRVHVRLIDARDGSTRWTETYDREVGDIFAVQSDIARAVARALDLRLGRTTLQTIQRGATNNYAAHELYLRGNDAALMRTDSTARVALDYFTRAAALDTNYAAAYAGIARATLRARFGRGGEERPLGDRMALAEQAALKAVALGDSVGDAHAALGAVRKSHHDLAGAETELRRAADLEPTTARFREYLVQLYVIMERPKDALLEAQRARDLDPLSPTATAEFARALIANDRCDDALVQLDRLKSLQPLLLRANSLTAQCYARKKMWPEAIAAMQRIAEPAGPQAEAVIGYLLARSGRPDEARPILATMLDRERRLKTGAFQVATVYAGLGDNDQAFAWLDKSFDDWSLNFENMIPLEGLRDDPRYARFRRRLNGQKR
jgi:TolB-like protein/DNA-binding SARP family transcriptional activator/tetratricopeptide (TPR) repeat protein